MYQNLVIYYCFEKNWNNQYLILVSMKESTVSNIPGVKLLLSVIYIKLPEQNRIIFWYNLIIK